MNTELSIQILQAYATGLSAQSKLASKYADHATEEMAWVDKFIDRIIDLGGEAKVEAAPAQKVYTDPVEFLKADLEVSVREVPNLGKATLALAEDMTTYDLMKGYYQDEEEDMYWSDQQLKLIELIGLQNWLVRQL